MVVMEEFVSELLGLNLTIDQISEKTGFEVKTIKSILKSKKCKIPTLIQICKKLNLKIPEFINYKQALMKTEKPRTEIAYISGVHLTTLSNILNRNYEAMTITAERIWCACKDIKYEITTIPQNEINIVSGLAKYSIEYVSEETGIPIDEIIEFKRFIKRPSEQELKKYIIFLQENLSTEAEIEELRTFLTKLGHMIGCVTK
jgi:hypothetical protein